MIFSIDNPEGAPFGKYVWEKPSGHIQIILSGHVSLKIWNTYIKLDFSATRPG